MTSSRTTLWKLAAAAAVMIATLAIQVTPARAQFRNFPDIKWLSFETEHFVIHYYAETEWTARRTAKYAELAYPKITGMFDYPLKEKTHIVVRDQEDIANGFAVFSEDWITIWADNLYYRLRGRFDWIPNVVTHEFSHIVSLKANSFQGEGAFILYLSALHEDGSRDIDMGASMLMGLYAPFWWVEGGAEYWTHLAGFNWWTTSRDMLLRMAVLEENYLDSSEWSTRSGKEGFGGELGYNQGYSTGLYVLETFGKENYADMAINSAASGHLEWEDNVEDVLGITAEELHARWLAWIKKKYEAMIEPIRKEEVRGELLSLVKPKMSWEETMKLPKDEKRRLLHKDMFSLHPRFSPDGKWLSLSATGVLKVLPVPKAELPQFGAEFWDPKKAEAMSADVHALVGVPFMGEGYGWSPDSRKIVVGSINCLDAWAGCPRFDSYIYNDLYVYDLATEKTKRITRGLRAVNPDWAPDGKDILFVRNVDGQQHLGLIKPDGTDIRWLLARWDGTQIDMPRFSPDGSKITFALYRNGQQDVWIINRDGTGLRPLTWDAAEDRDPVIAPDGRLYWSSDRTGIFNIYSMDLETGDVLQITNVISGAFSPTVTSEGHMLYTHFTSFGFKTAALKGTEFFNKPIETDFDVPEELVAESLILEEELPEIEERTEKYRWWKNLQPPFVVPLLIYENDGVSGGLFVSFADYVGKHDLIAQVLLGADQVLFARYTNNMLYPTLFAGAVYVALNDAIHQTADIADDPWGYEDTLITGKRRLKYDLEFVGAMWAPTGDSSMFRTFRGLQFQLVASRLHVTFQLPETGSKAFPLWTSWELTLSMRYQSIGFGDGGINPRGGRFFELYLNVFKLDTLFEGGGLLYDDVEDIAESTAAFEVGLTYTERIAVPWFKKYLHSLDLSLILGIQNRNLSFNNFFAGNVHPLRFIPRASANTAFAGYEDFSIRGETMVIFNMAYRFPIVRRIDKKISVFYFDSIYAQVFASAGNIWGYTCDYPTDEAGRPLTYGNAADHGYIGVGSDPDLDHFFRDVYCPPGRSRREIPFIDIAQSNGNYLLYDVGFDIMFKANIYNYLPWNSFIRFAYGLNDLKSTADANDDGIYSNSLPGDPLSDERESKRFRVTIGIGASFF